MAKTYLSMATRVILYNLRSAHNVGSIFRTSDGAGIEKIYLVGPTPTPIDRFGRVQSEIKKTSLGASESVAWEHIGARDSASLKETLKCIHELQASGWQVVAVEQTPAAISHYTFAVPQKVVYIFGHEVDGLPKEITEVADQVIEIPMQGTKESLNVSVAAGIILFL